ncbi:hypothetical protein [uncultured Thermomonospora sp.]|jgi:hypothetical protein|uniref:Uncharacterized protein n=1 Tax=Candidatus Agrococcus pullicola TaxID=2838429 RepID=A0A9D2C9S2_9MICO|nr:hypothetical protein [uncultured Thermomonospora sp.]HIY65690.1 hypothetical protein [Candidatus Agrococcus pullicola]
MHDQPGSCALDLEEVLAIEGPPRRELLHARAQRAQATGNPRTLVELVVMVAFVRLVPRLLPDPTPANRARRC